LGQRLGRAFITANRAGGGGSMRATEVAKAAPDGYTILMGAPGTQAINQYLYSKMPYNTEKDFAAVSFVARVPNVLVVNPATRLKSLKELIAFARANPNKLNAASPGSGSTGHLSLELLKSMPGVQLH